MKNVLPAIAFALCGSCLLGAQPGDLNLLPGDAFKHMADNVRPEGWRGDFGKGVSIIEDSAGRYMKLVNEKPGSSISASIQAPIPITPDIERIAVEGKVNVLKVVPGKESWHDARIAVTFKRADGVVARHDAVAWTAPTNGWVEFKKEFMVDAGISECGFSPSIFMAEADFELRDLKLRAVKEMKDTVSWSLDDAWRLNTKTRERICLNGVWKIQLAKAVSMAAAAKGVEMPRVPVLDKTLDGATKWTQIRVPGQWYCADWSHFTWTESPLCTKGFRGPQAGVCNQILVDGKPLKELCCAWYEREFKLPADWKGSESFLKFDDVDLEAWIYVNDTLLAYQEGNMSKEIPLPDGLRPGDVVKLNALVYAEVSGMEQIVMGGGESYLINRKKESLNRGIPGDVWLLRHPAIRSEDIRISASTRENELKVRFNLSESTWLNGGRVELEVASWKDGKQAKLFKASISDANLTAGIGREFSFPWNDAHRWSPEDPYLYTAKLRIYNSAGLLEDESEPVRFGFREIWIDGKDYYLNGSPLHFMRFISGPEPKDAALGLFRYYRELGYNSVHLLPGQQGTGLPASSFFEAADETGMLVMLQLPSVNDYSKIWERGGREKWISKTLPVMREAWNSPSLVHWSMSFNMLGYAFDMFPELIGIETNRKFGPVADIIKESENIALGFDSSRPVLHHACGSMGAVHTSNIYLNFVQPQEKNEWLLDFNRKAVKPFFAVELGMPYINTYNYGRLGFGDAQSTEPLLAEYAAMYDGDGVFARTSGMLAKLAASDVERGASHGGDKYVPRIALDGEALYIETQARLAEFLKYWRASGASGMHPWATSFWRERKTMGFPVSYESLKTPGIKTLFSHVPDYSGENLLYARYKELLSPLLGFIGGPNANFTERRRNYRAGESIDKSVVIVNDSPKDFNGDVQVRLLSAAGKPLAEATVVASVAKGRTGIFEFSLKAPPCDGREALKIEIGTVDGSIKDSFQIQVMAKSEGAVASSIKRRLWLLDKNGSVGRELSARGLKFNIYGGEKLGAGDLLAIGRESADACGNFTQEIRSSVCDGANMLVFEQSEKDLAKYFGLRSFASSSRKLFTGAATARILPGFQDSDFMDWAGKASLLVENPKPSSDSYPVHIWKRGNGGIVASVAIEKPQTGRFLPLLHEGFNLNYSPLLLEYCGKGMALYCQLDLNARSEAEPVAEKLYGRLLQLADAWTAPRSGKLVYSGAKDGIALLDCMGIDFEVSEKPGQAKLWVIGENAKALDENGLDALREFLKDGGQVVFLNHKSPAASVAKLGLKCGDFQMDGFALAPKNLGLLTGGLTAADWCWKDKMRLAMPEESSPLKEFQVGAGSLLVCQIDPLQFQKDEMNQRRYASRLKMFRCLSAALAAKGAAWKRSCLDNLSGVGQSDFDLAGEWKFRTDPEDQGEREGWAAQGWTDKFRKLNVPGNWESQGATDANPHFKNSEMPYDGVAWYQREMELGRELVGKELYLEMGAVDDCDWTYFNGRLIGKTGKETPGWYAAKRLYKIPEDAIKFGNSNLIAVKVFDDYMAGGIVTGPVRIFVKKDKEDFPYLEGPEYPKHDPYLFQRW